MNEMPKLTDRQHQILDLVQSAIERTGAPPTRAEIASELGFKSANAAEEHLQALARKGVIELVGGTSRGIRLKSETLRALNEARLAPFGKQYSLPLPGLARLRLYTYRWTSLLVWLYVAEGAVRATSEHGIGAWLAGIEMALATTIFFACATHVRARFRHAGATAT